MTATDSDWKSSLRDAVFDCLRQEDATPTQLWDTLWQYGILKRIGPKEKTVNDPTPYIRMLYSIAHAVRTLQQELPISEKSLAYGILVGFNIVMEYSEWPPWIWKIVRQNNHDLRTIVLREMTSRIRMELRTRSKEEHNPLIPIGTRGKIWDLNVTIDGYTEEGLLELRETKILICPSTLNPKDFT